MFNLKNLFSRALLALMLVAGSGAALAGPTYHVTIDSTGYTGTGTIDFLLSSYVPSSDGSAFVSNFTGNSIGQGEMMGDVSGDLGSGLLLGTRDGFGVFAQALDLGRRFSFDVRFDPGSFNDGLGFSVGLFSDTLGQYLGQNGTLVAIELTPGEPNLVLVDAALASAAEVPEPATLAAMMLGLTLMGSTLRARRRK
jgi:hypothetical protein